MTDRCGHRPCRGITQRTDRIAFNFTLNIPEQINITHLPFPIFNIHQDFFHPACSFAAGRTLSATFMTVKSGECKCMFHDALVFIQNNKSSGSHHGSFCKSTIGKAFIIHQSFFSFCGFKKQVGRKNGYGRSAWYTGFQSFSFGDASAPFVAINKFFHGNRHVDFIYAGLVDIAAS